MLKFIYFRVLTTKSVKIILTFNNTKIKTMMLSTNLMLTNYMKEALGEIQARILLFI